MAKYLFFVENNSKAEAITLLAGDLIDVVVLEEVPAVYSLRSQEQRGGSVFTFTPVSSVWTPVVERLTGYKEVYYTFDTSMDGEYISFLVDKLLVGSSMQSRGHRLHLAGLTEGVLRGSMDIVEPLHESRCMERLYYHLFHTVFFTHLSRLLGTTYGPGHVELSMATLTLFAMLVEKYEFLKQRGRQSKWEVDVRVQQDGQEVVGRLAEIYGVTSDGFLASGKQAKEIAESLKHTKFSIIDRSEEELVFVCPQLYTLPELVSDACRFYQMQPCDVMAGLQELFTGVDLGQGKVGLISSLYGVSLASIEPVFVCLTQFVQETYGDAVEIKKEIADGVILPLNPAVHPDDMQLSPVLAQLYELIWARSVASQMIDAVGSDKKVLFEAEGKRIQFVSLTLVQKGFLAVFKHGYEAYCPEECSGLFQGGDSVIVDVAFPQQVQPEGLSHYQIPSLCKEMREMGFDDVKMILTLLQQLFDHHYVFFGGVGEIMCTDTLLKVTTTIDRAFPGMKGMNLVAYYAQTLEEVLSGRKRVDVALKQFDQNFMMQGKPLVKVKLPVSVPRMKRKSRNVIKGGVEKVTKVEPVAEGFMNFSTEAVKPEIDECSSAEEESVILEEAVVEEEEEKQIEPEVMEDQLVVPEIESLPDEPLEEVVVEEKLVEISPVEAVTEVVPVEVVETPPSHQGDDPVKSVDQNDESDDLSAMETRACPECGRSMVVKDDRFGKFWACTGRPACHHSETYHKKKDIVQPQLCPVCKHGILSVNRTPAGKDMYVCSDSVCEFIAWAKPYAIDCPLCGSPFLIQKKDRAGNVNLRCPVAGCSYVHGELSEEGAVVTPKKKMVRVRRKKSGAPCGKKRRVVRRRKK